MRATPSVLNVNVRLWLPYRIWPGSQNFWYISPSLISDKEHDGDCLLLITFSIFCHIPSSKTREISFIKWERNLMFFNVTSTIFKCHPNIMRITILLVPELQKNSFWFNFSPHFLTLRESKKGNNICKKDPCLLLGDYIKDYIMVFMYVFTLLQRVFWKLQ